ncbi:alpha/beta hydrolase [Pseudonocardia sp.]|uniref:alpha/beta hydrolase n=1 Tax=Pseudonocardia sp. TaxID=60912 RepID=UPI002F3F4D8C
MAHPILTPAPVPAIVESRPGDSLGARILAPAMRRTIYRALDLGRPSAAVLRAAFLFDYLGGLLRAPRGTRVRRVRFPRFRAEFVSGPGVPRSGEARGVILYFHGGGFMACGLRTHRRLVARISRAAGVPVFNVAYRQLPTATLDETLRDCLDAYQLLLREGHRPDRIVFAGDSAGGYLAFAAALRAAAESLPAPAGIVGLSPWLDLECRHSRDYPTADTDPYLPKRRVIELAALVTGGAAPLAPILDADLRGLPPALIQVGSVELLCSDAEQMTQRLANAGVPVRLQVWQRQVHVFQAFADLVPEAHAAITEIGGFVSSALRPARDHRPAAPHHEPETAA